MRFKQLSVKALGTATAIAAGCLMSVGSGVAHADSVEADSIYAPSALVLTVGRGTDSATAAVQRAVVLECAPRPRGTHPAAGRACGQLASVGGRFEQLVRTEGSTGAMCTRIWDPVVVTAEGVWKGQRVDWQHTFANPCTMKDTGSSVFAF
ncbi:subtilase-type protease inhibitor [Streptomyces marispadix]|uniref:Probable subtilase-type protease inhibitor n=1 Tax=Streptomyces marispadix TaxID=2922868 RepID=A0ABS9T5F7_9ACTN|nr:subtilase-type protease inhibitor [Streptomyces marispadix]MCH6163757.1 subtilase-type protease inhibitor [Streptomyces marispadix]